MAYHDAAQCWPNHFFIQLMTRSTIGLEQLFSVLNVHLAINWLGGTEDEYEGQSELAKQTPRVTHRLRHNSVFQGHFEAVQK